jgi:hypothetical protein
MPINQALTSLKGTDTVTQQRPQNKQIWKDAHAPSKNRYVKVLQEANEEGMVKIQTVFASMSAGFMPTEVTDGQISWAREDRFDGSTDGYAYSASSILEFRRKKLHVVGFTQMLAKQPKIEIGELVVGEFWQEVCGKHSRIVEILADVESGKKQIVTRYFTAITGTKPVEIVGAKPTLASSSRFNGKSGGYRFIAKTEASLKASGVLEKTFVSRDDVYIVERVLAISGTTVKKNQLWQDLRSDRLRIVTILGAENHQVELRTQYLGATESEPEQRIDWEKSEIVDMEVFASKGFALIKAA